MNKRLLMLTAILFLALPIFAEDLYREHIGNNLFARDATLFQDNEIRFYTLSNIRFGHGQGDNFSEWRRPAASSEWEQTRVPLPKPHMPGMISNLRLGKDATLYLYVDRKDNSNMHLYLQRVSAKGELQTLFDLPEDEEFKRFLNPHMDLMPDGQIHLLLPDRSDVFVRRFVIDPANGAHKRLPDIRMPRTGARIYDRLILGAKLIIPVSVIDEMLILIVDLNDHSIEMHSVDRFSSPSKEPPRNTSIFYLEDSNEFILFYLRPAKFSDRSGLHGPRTGLVGEHVCTVVSSETFEKKRSTVIAGFEAEAAATHNADVIRVGNREFLFAHTEVNRIHQRHLTGAYENYVGSFLTCWKINDDGVPLEIGRQSLPFMSFFTLASSGDSGAILLCNEARQSDPLYLYHIKLSMFRGK